MKLSDFRRHAPLSLESINALEPRKERRMDPEGAPPSQNPFYLPQNALLMTLCALCWRAANGRCIIPYTTMIRAEHHRGAENHSAAQSGLCGGLISWKHQSCRKRSFRARPTASPAAVQSSWLAGRLQKLRARLARTVQAAKTERQSLNSGTSTSQAGSLGLAALPARMRLSSTGFLCGLQT